MLYVFVFLILFILVTAIIFIFIKNEKFSKKNKIIISIFGILVIITVTIYQLNFNKKSLQNKEKIILFNQGQTLVCKGYKVDQKNFIYFGGTNSFVAKDDANSFKGVILKLEECEVE